MLFDICNLQYNQIKNINMKNKKMGPKKQNKIVLEFPQECGCTAQNTAVHSLFSAQCMAQSEPKQTFCADQGSSYPAGRLAINLGILDRPGNLRSYIKTWPSHFTQHRAMLSLAAAAARWNLSAYSVGWVWLPNLLRYRSPDPRALSFATMRPRERGEELRHSKFC